VQCRVGNGDRQSIFTSKKKKKALLLRKLFTVPLDTLTTIPTMIYIGTNSGTCIAIITFSMY
jgi:hypothetical protein